MKTKITTAPLHWLLLLIGLTACSDSTPGKEEVIKSHATTHTAELLQDYEDNHMPIGDFLDGSMMKDHSPETLIAPLPDGVGALTPGDFAFVNEQRPDTIHPSIFGQMKVKSKDSGLYRLNEHVYQIRGDLADITLVRGERGWIVLDAGTTQEFTGAAWAFAHPLLPGGTEVPISTVVYSHSHVDHFGGVRGLISQQDVDNGSVQVIAPFGFMEEALAENVIAGSAMFRRAQYHFGANLNLEEDGTGLFYLPIKPGLYTLIAPTLVLPQGQSRVTELTVDGVPILFKDISGAEAPAATLIYLPELKMIFNSELMFRGLHNVYTLRGAQVRDALAWSKLINDVLLDWGQEAELMTGPHGPTFAGNNRIREYMSLQRDNYGFIHNQALRMINSGMKLQDVGPTIEEMVPKNLSQVWHTHGYHGTYSHNARGVVNRYIGFYDGNPANLNPLKLKPEAEKYVDYMGGSEAILSKATTDFDQGNYRFVATVLNKLVTAEPDNWPARNLLADTYQQLGYQSEGPQWRNAYLTAAIEMRSGQIQIPAAAPAQTDMLKAATIENILDSVAVRVDAAKAEDKSSAFNLVVPDTGDLFYVQLVNSNLSYGRVDEPLPANLTLTLNKRDILRLMSGQIPMTDIVSLGADAITGSPMPLVTLLRVLSADQRFYPIVPMPD